MTAANILLDASAAYILTDGSMTGPDGSSVGTMSKVFPLPHLDAVVVSRGWYLAGFSLAVSIGTARRSFDDAAEHLAGDLAATRQAMLRGPLSEALGLRWDCYLVGWSDAERAFAARFCAFKGETFTTQAIGGVIAPAIPFEATRTFRPAIDGLEILRRQHAEHPHEVGGFAQLTTLRRGSILTTILERWPS